MEITCSILWGAKLDLYKTNRRAGFAAGMSVSCVHWYRVLVFINLCYNMFNLLCTVAVMYDMQYLGCSPQRDYCSELLSYSVNTSRQWKQTWTSLKYSWLDSMSKAGHRIQTRPSTHVCKNHISINSWLHSTRKLFRLYKIPKALIYILVFSSE